jgi:hypothetical protein
MHPLIAAGVANTLFNDRAAAARTHRTRRTRGPKNSGSGRPSPSDEAMATRTASPGRFRPASAHRLAAASAAEVVIRLAAADDATALVRLGALDSDRHAGELLARAADEHGVLVAEVDGSLEAAVALDGGLAVADPFRPSAPHARLLALRARQLGGDAPRRRGSRFGVLHPRTS